MVEFQSRRGSVLAPTRPLIDQHLDSFRKALRLGSRGLQVQDLTANTSPKKRAAIFLDPAVAVLIMTPQTLHFDLAKGRYTLGNVGLVVFDEAPRPDINNSACDVLDLPTNVCKTVGTRVFHQERQRGVIHFILILNTDHQLLNRRNATPHMHKATIGRDPSQIFFGLALFQILAMFRRGIFYTFLAIYMRAYLGLSITATSFYATLPALLSAFFQMMVWGRLSDRTQNRRTYMIIGEFIPGSMLLAVFWLHQKVSTLISAGYILILGFSFIEIFWSMSNLGFTTIISDLYGPIRRNKIMNYLVAIGGISRMVGIYLSGLWYQDGWAFREGLFFYIASGVIFLSILPLLLLPKHVDPDAQLGDGAKLEANVIEIPEKLTHPKIPLKRIFVILLVGLSIINLGRGGVGVVYPQFLILSPPGLAFNSARIALNSNIQSFAMVIAGLIMGKLSQRLGFTNLLFIGLISGSLASLGTILLTHPLEIYICSALLGASEVMIGTGAYVYASVLIPPTKRAQFFGIYSATFSIAGGLGGSALISPIIDHQLGASSTPEQNLYAFQLGLGVAVGFMAAGILILCVMEWRLHVLPHKRPLLEQ